MRGQWNSKALDYTRGRVLYYSKEIIMTKQDKILEVLARLVIVSILAFCFWFHFNMYHWSATATKDVQGSLVQK